MAVPQARSIRSTRGWGVAVYVAAASAVFLSTAGGGLVTPEAAAGDSAQLADQDANVQISPLAVTSRVTLPGSPVTLTGHVNVSCDPGSTGCADGFANAPAGTPITFWVVSRHFSLSSFVTPDSAAVEALRTRCETVLETGSCSVQLTSPDADVVTVRAETAISFDLGDDTVTVARATGDGRPGDGPDAVTTWVDSRISIGPTGFSRIPGGSRQSLVATVDVENGINFDIHNTIHVFKPAPDGTAVTFVKDPASTTGTFSTTAGGADTATCTTTGGTCSVDVDSSATGSMKVTASASPLGGPPGSKIAAPTGASSPATKVWIGAGDPALYAPVIRFGDVGKADDTPDGVPAPTGLVIERFRDWARCTGSSVDEILQLDADGLIVVAGGPPGGWPPTIGIPWDSTPESEFYVVTSGTIQFDYAGDANYLPQTGPCQVLGEGVSPEAPPHQPSVKIVQITKSQPDAVGDSMTFEITVSNTGDTRLDAVAVTDPLAPDCNRKLGSIDPGENRLYSCQATVASPRFSNRTFVAAASPSNTKVYDDSVTLTLTQLRTTASAETPASSPTPTPTSSSSAAAGAPPTSQATNTATTPYPHSFTLTNGLVARWAPVLRRVAVRAQPASSARVVTRLEKLTPDGTQNLVLALDGIDVGPKETWYHVRLPILPHNSTGWVPAGDLGNLTTVHTHLYVDRAKLTATLKRDGVTVFTTSVGIGRPQSPTPAGEFYVLDKLTGSTLGNRSYGPLGFGTSAVSTVRTDWPGGGLIGLIGTNKPRSLPGRVSHGSIRMPNEKIRALAKLMPFGTPVTIR